MRVVTGPDTRLRFDAEPVIYDEFANLLSLQASSINEQQRLNVQVLTPRFKEIAPPVVYTPTNAMNAAYALFCDDLFGEGGYSTPYRSAGFVKQGQRLLDRWQGSNQSGWSHPEMERLITACETTLERGARNRHVVAMMQLASQDLPVIPLLQPVLPGAREELRGPEVYASDDVVP